MSLVKAKTCADVRPITCDNEIAAKIQRRRYQLLVHSLLYYELDTSIIPDSKWSEWAVELSKLQDENPEIASRVIFADSFKYFDGSTGFNLPYRDEQIVKIAARLLRHDTSAESADALHRLKYQVSQTPSEWEKYRQTSHAIKPTQPKKEASKIEQKPRKGLFSVSRT